MHCRYDDLRNYSNERSIYLAQLRNSIEEPWQQWELGHFDIEAYKSKNLDEVPAGSTALLIMLSLPAMPCMPFQLLLGACISAVCAIIVTESKKQLSV